MGSRTDLLTIANVPSVDAGNYQVIVSNAYGMVTGAVATLNVLLPPTITAQPQNTASGAGGTVSAGRLQSLERARSKEAVTRMEPM